MYFQKKFPLSTFNNFFLIHEYICLDIKINAIKFIQL